MKNRVIAALLLTMSSLAALPFTAAADDAAETRIELSDEGILVDGTAIGEEGAVYAASDIVYYEDRDTYDSGNPYGEGSEADKHSEAEAAEHTVVHISEPGTYRISGTLSKGQIAVDLGEGAKEDPEAVVTLIMDQADITCTVAPAVIFYQVYECESAFVTDSDSFQASAETDTSAAGANVVLADGSVNNVNGSYVAKIYKDQDGESKKKCKYDGAFYSRMSMNICGEETGDGVLNIVAANEGLDSELHLTINSGVINIESQDDAINTNEDGVSVTTINGGCVHINGGLGEEGDGVDSNGYLVINGGVVISSANPASDSGLDSDMGSYINGGIVISTGSTMDWAESESNQVTMNLQFASMQGSDEAIVITDTDGKVVFAYAPNQDETSGEEARGYQGAVLSTPLLEVGKDYNVYIGGTVTGTEVNGLYDTSETITFTDSVQMQYSGTTLGGFGGFNPGMGMPDGERPEMPDGKDFSGGERPEMPEGMQPPSGGRWEGMQQPNGEMPEGMQPPSGEMPEGMQKPGGEMPEGMQPPSGERPETPEGMERSDGGFNNGGQEAEAYSTVFTMTDKVNAFSNVTEAE